MSHLRSGRRARRLRTATIMASRLRSTPRATRWGMARLLGATRACTSARRQRVPSITGATAEPERRSPSSRNTDEGSATSTSPCSAIWKTPTSLVEPKRFFTARRMRKGWARSPSKDRTASTMCSSTRGPANSPSLVTCPTRIRAMFAGLGHAQEATGGVTDLDHRPGSRPQFGRPQGLHGVDHAHGGTEMLQAGHHRLRLGLAEKTQAAGAAVQAVAAQLHLSGRLLARDEQRGDAGLPPCAATPGEASVLLPTPGSPPSRTTEPATRPPPSTRSSSPRPVPMRT